MLCGEPFSVNAQIAFAFRCAASRRAASLGSFSSGFSSASGYVPATRLCGSFERERLCTLWVDHFPGALPVFIRVTRNVLRLPSKPFGFGSERTKRRLSAPSVLKRRVTTSVSPFGTGQNARKQSRLCSHSTPEIFFVKGVKRILPLFYGAFSGKPGVKAVLNL